MEKDFDGWNEQKKRINVRSDVLLYHERDIRWCQLGVNVGFEQDGSGLHRARPVLVFKAFSRSVCLVVPLTTSAKRNQYYVPIGTVGSRKASAIISQIRLIDTKRLDRKIENMKEDIFDRVRKAVRDML